MEKAFLKNIRRSLLRHRANLFGWLKNGKANRYLQLGEEKEVSMPSTLRIINEIDTAIEQLDHGTFGQCEMCSGEVEEDRLILDFTTCICLDHYSEAQKRELERDLELAAEVQQHLLPGSLPALEGVQMAVFARPFGAVGGDYYDFFRYKDCCQGMAIADVMGKGVPAGMLMANLQASLRIMGPDFEELSQLGVRLNELFRYNLKQIRFITLFLAGIDPQSKTLHYVNAGHHPPLLWNANRQSEQWLKPTGPAIGLMPSTQYHSESVTLRSGDWLILYTDGLVEAKNRHQQEFGFDGLMQYASSQSAASPELFVNGLMKEVESSGALINDDLTLIVLKID